MGDLRQGTFLEVLDGKTKAATLAALGSTALGHWPTVTRKSGSIEGGAEVCPPTGNLGEMLDRLDVLRNEFAEVTRQMSDPEVVSDQKKLATAGRRFKQLQPIIAAADRLSDAHGDLDAARELMELSEGEERQALHEEAESAERCIAEIGEELKILLLPRDPNDDKNVIVEVRGTEGGEEANLWAGDLFTMYQRWAEKHGWKLEVLGTDPSPMGGLNEASFLVKGESVWTRLKFEGGTHRVQRVPVTEAQGRIHTSAATVMVLPEAEEVDVDLNEHDLKVDVYRSSGPGGQSVNTTDSAVRITHLPTGTVVSMQDEKSQLQNKAKALMVLRSRLLQAEQEAQAAEASAARRSQVGGGGRSEKIRTYNYKENRVTDHRIGLTLYKLDRVLQGDLDEISDGLIADERMRLLASEESGN